MCSTNLEADICHALVLLTAEWTLLDETCSVVPSFNDVKRSTATSRIDSARTMTLLASPTEWVKCLTSFRIASNCRRTKEHDKKNEELLSPHDSEYDEKGYELSPFLSDFNLTLIQLDRWKQLKLSLQLGSVNPWISGKKVLIYIWNTWIS